MNNFYYTANPDVKHEEKHWNFSLLKTTLSFVTDNGVFSKNTVDYGSRVLIKNVDINEMPAGPILDMGCGYGPIGIFLAKTHPERQFTMVDVNNLALSLAKQNAELNQISNVDIFASDGYQNVTQKYAGIVTNPPVRAGKKVVDEMITGSYDHLLDDGTLTVVLQKKQGAPSAKKLMKQIFGNVQIVKRDKGYYLLKSRKAAADE
ncbi:class I SAM-dependent methyltransferase [Fructilactobacillus fructivorans]|uniref:Ribosomal RNA small subunit methyltransferase C n=1 Tax=Fructilactobacillus fructivorans TaxID=1614 RepID=A0A0C1LXY4_9LACO|nr:class I SAM-dependent methyltransferase [Fructilactobacillus fructivorans]KID41705.1 Ribosomal RNA small subunit methyltransferase C [Fructilactobacillus fructivorans]MCT0151357.1 class I SAM-dependent methyltransferase [Fructilactobacillus fructivorans]MCT2867566.1 class I SAM-dependent methyltransferase [Fructilactobacillus fructivorans]MCT2868916.1 class I SAM-dependent methyltransferase [Fructilactobacillus fructivorans]MCT2873914.1 class I SAM-dependent methyltransferase [Fructilactoba